MLPISFEKLYIRLFFPYLPIKSERIILVWSSFRLYFLRLIGKKSAAVLLGISSKKTLTVDQVTLIYSCELILQVILLITVASLSKMVLAVAVSQDMGMVFQLCCSCLQSQYHYSFRSSLADLFCLEEREICSSPPKPGICCCALMA